MAYQQLRRIDLRVVPGATPEEAFARGAEGHGDSLLVHPPLTPLFLALADRQRTMMPPYSTSLFAKNPKWRLVEDSDLVKRFTRLLWSADYRRSIVDLLVYATLPGANEAPESPESRALYDRALVVAGTRAVAMLLLGDVRPGELGCIEVPVAAGELRRFLFFGTVEVS